MIMNKCDIELADRYINYFARVEPGTTTVLWWLIWFAEISEDPSRDKKISREELEYLTSTIPAVHRTKVTTLIPHSQTHCESIIDSNSSLQMPHGDPY